MESESTCGEDGAVIFAGKRKGGYAARVGMGLDEAEERDTGDGFDAGGHDGFSGDPVSIALQQSGKAYCIAGADHTEEKEAAFAGRDDELDAPTTDTEEVVSGITFSNEYFAALVMAASAE